MIYYLAGGFTPSEKYIKILVSWGYCSQFMAKLEMFQTINQLCILPNCKAINSRCSGLWVFGSILVLLWQPCSHRRQPGAASCPRMVVCWLFHSITFPWNVQKKCLPARAALSSIWSHCWLSIWRETRAKAWIDLHFSKVPKGQDINVSV